MIERALEKFGGNRRRAAEELKVSTVTLWSKDEAVRPFILKRLFDSKRPRLRECSIQV
jgi:hypothetical protein